MKVCKMALLLAFTDFIICLIAFIIESVYVDNNLIYFKAVDYSRSIRIIVFSLFVILVLISGEDLGRLKKLNDLSARLFLFQFLIYSVDFVKVIIAHDGIEIWQELYYVKKVGHIGIIIWYRYRINKFSKELSYITN